MFLFLPTFRTLRWQWLCSHFESSVLWGHVTALLSCTHNAHSIAIVNFAGMAMFFVLVDLFMFSLLLCLGIELPQCTPHKSFLQI